MSLGVIENCLWSVFKLYICILYPRIIDKDGGEGAGCIIVIVIINLFTGYKAIISIFSCLLLLIFVLTVKEEIQREWY